MENWLVIYVRLNVNVFENLKKNIFSDGKQSLERRFLASDSLQTVLDYLTIEGFHSEEYKVLSSWPRRDVSFIFFCC